MHVFRIWRLLCVLGFVGASSGVNGLENEGNFADNYDNEVSQDQQEGETPTTPCRAAADFSRWDKLFITLEDSHMRQNMLLESLEQCRGGMLSLGTRVDELAEGTTCQQSLPGLEASVRLQRGLLELREEEAERERGLNAALRQLLYGGREANARLKRLEEGGGHGAAAAAGGGGGGGGGGMGRRPTPTPRPGGLGAALGLGVTKPLAYGPEEQEATSPPDMAAVGKALVAIATELRQVHVQLSRAMEEHAGRTEETRTEEAHGLPRGKKIISD